MIDFPRQTTAPETGMQSDQSFKDMRSTFTEEQVMKETERCLSCGAAVVDPYQCIGCGACVTKCRFDAVSLVRQYDAAGVELKEMKPTIKKYMVKRKVKIAAHNIPKSIKSVFKKEDEK
ncbi:4Fe-4S binding protein [Bacillus carboniphilus]|uniref:4Fe-4S binding protein n=1 Tax=Bacillus carboniphilus TaxID=86663 RepID=A0ABY9JTL9_9BACI|nr:4Fe-4S binding protein [Bacillus carboniphilus]WLR42702.1 4Fe-4S binding protein [Bacillus carboniphilus]